MTTILEQELSKEQIAWILSHLEHEQVKNIIIGARVAGWDGIKEKTIEEFKLVCASFRKWWGENRIIMDA